MYMFMDKVTKDLLIYQNLLGMFVRGNINCAFLTVFISNHPLSEVPRSNRKTAAKFKLVGNIEYGEREHIPYEQRVLGNC